MPTTARSAASCQIVIASPDRHHLLAAEGWLDLGNWREAKLELEAMTPRLRGHPDVWCQQFRVCLAAGRWADAVILGEALVRSRPECAQSWIDRAQAYFLGGQCEKALNKLRPAWIRFPKNATVAYRAACYCARLGRVPDARWWMFRCLESPGAVALLPTALADPELEALWDFNGFSESAAPPPSPHGLPNSDR